MKYGLEPLDQSTFTEITKERFDELTAAKDATVLALGIEEKFGLLLANYADFEGKLLDYALGDALYGFGNWTEGIDRLMEINRRLFNFLSASRLYLDQVPHALNGLFGSSNQITADFQSWTNEEYDSVLGYRVLDELRNHAQHCDFPLHMSGPQAWVSDHDSPTRQLRRSFGAYIVVSELEDHRSFKPRILEELLDVGRKVDIRPLARTYVSSLGRIHKRLQVCLQPELDRFVGLLEDALSGHQAGLSVVQLEDSGSTTQAAYISNSIIERWRRSVERHQYAQHFERMHISSETLNGA